MTQADTLKTIMSTHASSHTFTLKAHQESVESPSPITYNDLCFPSSVCVFVCECREKASLYVVTFCFCFFSLNCCFIAREINQDVTASHPPPPPCRNSILACWTVARSAVFYRICLPVFMINTRDKSFVPSLVEKEIRWHFILSPPVVL